MKKVINVLIGLPVALVLISLAIANRHAVTLVLDPFRPDRPALSLTLPFYAFVLGALIVGVAIGGIATWFNQGRWRHAANIRTREARRWQSEAERLSRERDDIVTQTKSGAAKSGSGQSLALAGRR